MTLELTLRNGSGLYLGIFDGLNVILGFLIKIFIISFIDTVNLPTRFDLDITIC